MKNNYMNINFHGAHIINCPEVARTADKFIESAAGDLIHLDDTQDENIAVTGWVKNLIPFPYADSSGINVNGVTTEYSADGVISASGVTGTGGSTFHICRSPITIRKPMVIHYTAAEKTGMTLCFAKTSNGVKSYLTIYANSPQVLQPGDVINEIYLQQMSSGVAVSISDLKVQLEEGSAAHPYVPFRGYDITSCGKNLCGEPVRGRVVGSNQEGFYFDPLENCWSFMAELKPQTTYTIKKYDIGDLFRVVRTVEPLKVGVAHEGIQYFPSTIPEDYTFTTDDRNLFLTFTANYGTFTEVFTPCIQLETGDTATEYEPYVSSTVHVDSETAAPVYGLKTFDGQTNIFNGCGAEMSVTYPLNESGKLIIDTAKNIYDEIAQMSAAAQTAADNAQSAANAAQETANTANSNALLLDAAYCTSESDMATKNLRSGALVLMAVDNTLPTT